MTFEKYFPNKKQTQKVEYLSSEIAVVAVINHEDKGVIPEWSAYIGIAPINLAAPWNHYDEIARHGTKINRKIAEILFPEEKKTHRWR